jgi:hypothetical protein
VIDEGFPSHEGSGEDAETKQEHFPWHTHPVALSRNTIIGYSRIEAFMGRGRRRSLTSYLTARVGLQKGSLPNGRNSPRWFGDARRRSAWRNRARPALCDGDA